jgi:hypothetical protein
VPQPTVLYGASGLPVQVDPTHQAARVSIRPIEYGLLGSYSVGSLSGIMAAGLAGAAPVICFRWAPTDTSKIALVRRLRFTAGNLATAFTAGGVTIAAFVARSFTAIDTGGAALVTSGNNCKRRTTQGASLLASGQVLVSQTATLTAGTRTLDANPFATITTAVTATAGIPIIPMPGLLYDPTVVGHYPLTLAVNEGVIVQATVPATGTWTFGWDIDWDEVVAF